METSQADTHSNVRVVSNNAFATGGQSCLVTEMPKEMLGWRGGELAFPYCIEGIFVVTSLVSH